MLFSYCEIKDYSLFEPQKKIYSSIENPSNPLRMTILIDLIINSVRLSGVEAFVNKRLENLNKNFCAFVVNLNQPFS